MPIPSVMSAATNGPTSATVRVSRVGSWSPDLETNRTTTGRTTRNITAMNTPVCNNTISASAALARTIPTTTARRHHAVTSSTAAHVSATAPRSVLVILRSARIRANTGNAVIDIATAMNKANDVNETSLVDKRGYNNSASIDPSTNGVTMLA